MVGITRMNVPEKMPKQLLQTKIHSLILIPNLIPTYTILINTDSYINVSMLIAVAFIQDGHRPVSTTFSYQFVSLFYSFYSKFFSHHHTTDHTRPATTSTCNLPAHHNPAQPHHNSVGTYLTNPTHNHEIKGQVQVSVLNAAQ